MYTDTHKTCLNQEEYCWYHVTVSEIVLPLNVFFVWVSLEQHVVYRVFMRVFFFVLHRKLMANAGYMNLFVRRIGRTETCIWQISIADWGLSTWLILTLSWRIWVSYRTEWIWDAQLFFCGNEPSFSQVFSRRNGIPLSLAEMKKASSFFGTSFSWSERPITFIHIRTHNIDIIVKFKFT